MRIVLISMPVPQKFFNKSMVLMPPLALYHLGAALKKNSYDVSIIDPITLTKYYPFINNREFDRFIKEVAFKYDIFCISSNTLNWSTNKFLISQIRKYNNACLIILGGLHPTYFFEHIMKTCRVDYIIKNDGEKALIHLLEYINGKRIISKVHNLVFRNGDSIKANNSDNTIDMHKSTVPLFEKLPDKQYSIMPFMTSIGCKYSCKFCSIPRKCNWIAYDTNSIISNYKIVRDNFLKKFTCNHIYLTDDCFTANSKRARILLESFYERNDYITLEARANDLGDKELLLTLQNKNIGRIAIGVECGYDEGLRKISKALTIDELEHTLNMLNKYSLMSKCYFSFIIGFPWETIEDCNKTIDYAASIIVRYKYFNVNVNWLNLLPSKLWDERKDFNINVNEDIFDDLLYSSLDDTFYLTHPNFSISDVNYINKRIEAWENEGVFLRNC